MFIFAIFTLFAIFSTPVLCVGDLCNSLTTCGDCIRSPQCVWCADTNYTNSLGFELPRCFKKDSKTGIQTCKSVTDLRKSYKAEVDKPFSSARDDVVQLRPQQATIELRPGEAQDIIVQYKQAEDYPVDLYLLLDLSNSMDDDLGNLRKLGTSLVQKMKSLTSNFRIGFGSFVEKNVAPFVRPNDVDNYSFKNHMKLSSNAQEFEHELAKANIVYTYDAPESGFDGMMQAIVCKNEIGWRDQARHLLLYATDASSHWAGDGRLAGIVRPNDGRCHLNSSGFYTESLTQDYPSVGHINEVVKDNNINLIFAVTSQLHEQYKVLNKVIEGSSTAPLAKDSSNVIQLVENQYRAITSAVELKDTATGNLRVTYFSTCVGKKEESQTNICTELRLNTQVDFRVRVEVTSCPVNVKNREQTFVISPVGIGESLSVTVKTLCTCPCEVATHPSYKEKALECSTAGALQCGVCRCDPGRSGRFCECDAESSISDDNGLACKPNNQTEKICSGFGSCICGKCECFKRNNPEEIISGRFCEEDNFNCVYSNGKLCAGNGRCDSGKCICFDGFSGTDCSCENSIAKCIPLGGGDVCSGNGKCQCGQCHCDEKLGAKGRYCEKCLTCPNKCDTFTECISCKMSNSTEHSQINGIPCDEACGRIEIRHEVKPQVEKEGDHECYFTIDNDCRTRFVYTFGDNGEKIVRIDESERDCPKPLDPALVSGSVVGVVVLIGILLLLLWRLLTYLYDKKEWARFDEERKRAKWNVDTNPLYREASETFANPTFGRTGM